MKNGSKLGCFLVLVTFCNSSLSMRFFAKKPIPTQGPSFQRRAHTTAVSTAAKTTPTFYNRIQQKFTELKTAGWNTWANLKNMIFKTPAVTIPQSIAFQESPEPISVPIITPTFQQIDQTELKKPEDIAPVLKAIELSKESLPEKKETSLMLCTPPGIEIDYISALQSFDAIKNFITTQKIRILTEAGLNRQEINEILLQLDRDQKYIYENAYTVPNQLVIHDTTFDPHILQEIMIKLKQAGINPLCVNIINKPKKDMRNAFGMTKSPLRLKELLIGQPTLIFSQELINNSTRENVAFVIGHEIGHLILCHNNAKLWIKKHITEILRKKHGLSEFEERTLISKDNETIEIDRDPLSIEIEEIINHALREIKTLFEIESDITYSLYDKNIAESSLRSRQAKISSGTFDTATMLSDLHQSINMQYHWFKHIRDLHKAQEAAKE